MEIVFLGAGNLANPIKIFLSKKNNVQIIPLRGTKISEFEEYFSNFKREKIFIDLMDPNRIDINTNFELIKKGNEVRQLVANSIKVKQYIYFSSANLYVPKIREIYEGDQILDQTQNKYLIMKKETEIFLKSLSLPVSICRVPNIWGHTSETSFFSDLIKAYKNKLKIEYVKGDEEVLSYINILDLSKLLDLIIQLNILGVVNLSTDNFNSRYNLKANINCHKNIEPINQKGIRLFSDKLKWEKFFKRRRLPF